MPILLLVNREEDFPQFILLILDAQNAKGAWSLRSVRQDTPVFLVLFSDSTTVQQACLHEGFAASGKSPGRFVPGSPESLDELVAKFRQGHLRSRIISRGQVIRWLAPNCKADAECK